MSRKNFRNLIRNFTGGSRFVAAIGQRIRQEREAAGLKQKDVAAKLGMQQSNLSAIEAGRRTPTMELLDEASSWSGASLEYLLFGEELVEGGGEIGLVAEAETPYCPLCRNALVITGYLAADAASQVAWVEGEVVNRVELPRHLEYKEVKGDSMAPLLWDGQWVGIDWEAEVHNGDIAAVVLKDGRTFVKRYWEREGRVHLQSLRPTAPERAELPEPDIEVPASKIRKLGKVRIHVLD